MTKTPEQMAEEEADRIERQAILCVSLLAMNDGEYFAAKKAYKAGYQAAKDEYETKVSELEIELENWKHTAIHGDEGL